MERTHLRRWAVELEFMYVDVARDFAIIIITIIIIITTTTTIIIIIIK